MELDRNISIDDIDFFHVCALDPIRGEDGEIIEYMPQSRYKGAGTTRLNPNGHGPFCKFRVPTNIHLSGVYVVTQSERVLYIGECVNFSSRWGLSQYGSISPKNCYVGGQSTNCKINHRVLLASQEGKPLDLWFHETINHKPTEAKLLHSQHPSWNSQF